MHVVCSRGSVFDVCVWCRPAEMAGVLKLLYYPALALLAIMMCMRSTEPATARSWRANNVFRRESTAIKPSKILASFIQLWQNQMASSLMQFPWLYWALSPAWCIATFFPSFPILLTNSSTFVTHVLIMNIGELRSMSLLDIMPLSGLVKGIHQEIMFLLYRSMPFYHDLDCLDCLNSRHHTDIDCRFLVSQCDRVP